MLLRRGRTAGASGGGDASSWHRVGSMLVVPGSSRLETRSCSPRKAGSSAAWCISTHSSPHRLVACTPGPGGRRAVRSAPRRRTVGLCGTTGLWVRPDAPAPHGRGAGNRLRGGGVAATRAARRRGTAAGHGAGQRRAGRCGARAERGQRPAGRGGARAARHRGLGYGFGLKVRGPTARWLTGGREGRGQSATGLRPQLRFAQGSGAGSGWVLAIG